MTEVVGGYSTGPIPPSHPKSEHKYVVFTDQPVSGLRLTARGDDYQEVIEQIYQMVMLVQSMGHVAGGSGGQAPGTPGGGAPAGPSGPPQQGYQAPPAVNQGYQQGGPPQQSNVSQGSWQQQPPQQGYQGQGQQFAQQGQAQGQQQGPPGGAPLCEHGVPRVWREGVSQRSGNAYKGWFCSQPRGQDCKPVYMGGR